jgi:hypothetical protein
MIMEKVEFILMKRRKKKKKMRKIFLGLIMKSILRHLQLALTQFQFCLRDGAMITMVGEGEWDVVVGQMGEEDLGFFLGLDLTLDVVVIVVVLAGDTRIISVMNVLFLSLSFRKAKKRWLENKPTFRSHVSLLATVE